jgi:DNA primase
MTDTIAIGGHDVEITHPERALFKRPTITKLDLARHYDAVAVAMLPHVRGRPLALQAYPHGIDGPGFYLKSIPAHFPDWIARATVPKQGGTVTHVVAENEATLVYLAGQNVITLHAWLSRADRGARIYLDVNRINYAQHAVAPYAVRAKARAPVAMPIEWDELSDPPLKPGRWTVKTAAERLDSRGDAWQGIDRRARSLPNAG